MELLFIFGLLVLVHLQNRDYARRKASEKPSKLHYGAAYEARKADGVRRLQERLARRA